MAQPVRSTGPEVDRHYRNVGLVAVAMAQLEETAAVIVYAARGGWDNTYEHLKEMAYSRHLQGALTNVRDGLAADAERRHINPDTGEVRLESGELRQRTTAFIEGFRAVGEERNRIVHSVVVQRPWDPELLAVHARGILQGRQDASRPLPTEDEITALVGRIDNLIREGNALAIRVAGEMDAVRSVEASKLPAV